MVADDAHQRDEHSARDVAYDLRQIGRTNPEDVDPEDDAAEGGDGTVEQTAAEDGAEGS